MALFIGIHDMGRAMTDEQAKSTWEAYKGACDKRGCKGIRTHTNTAAGKAFCLTEASSKEEAQAAHDDASIPVNEIIEVRILE